jgi:2-polyprenyl-6-methoxyphenol hydroxylase-like FAD-dependent oxidoreductase
LSPKKPIKVLQYDISHGFTTLYGMHTPVLIVGAGPTGLMMAAQLARFGIDFRIIDKNPHPSEKTKAIAVQARTLEIYDQMGLVDEVLAQGLKFTRAHVIGNVLINTTIPMGDFGEGQSPFPFMHIFTQDKNEKLLNTYLQQHNKHVEWNTSFVNTNDDGNNVRTTIQLPGGTEEIVESNYLVAADGGKSPVRHVINIPFEGETYEQVFFVADTAVDWKYGYGDLFICFGKNKLAAFFPMPGEKRFRVVSIIPEKLLTKENASFEDIIPMFAKDLNVAVRFYNTSWFSEYRIHHRVVNSFSKSNIFLAGDAAHIHSPAGGQGMNTGLQDAYNLAWKLASVIKHGANKKLLKTYNEERLPNAIRLVNTTDRAFNFLINANPLLRANIVPLVANIAIRINALKKNIFKGLSQIGISYHKYSLASGSTSKIKAGQRLPYVKLTSGSGESNVYDLLKAPSFHVLICLVTEIENDQLQKLSTSLPEILPGLIKPIVIDHKQKSALHTWGVKTNSLIIIRPDNYIGCIINNLEIEKVSAWFNEKILASR